MVSAQRFPEATDWMASDPGEQGAEIELRGRDRRVGDEDRIRLSQ